MGGPAKHGYNPAHSFRIMDMKPRIFFALLPLVFAVMGAGAASPAAVSALEELGRINGIALACKQPALGSRARNAVTTGAPKTREYGDLFEQATNTAFLAQGQGTVCPDPRELSQALDLAERALQAAFPRTP
jgi:hypothetical protein